jgi:hypothetical protein
MWILDKIKSLFGGHPTPAEKPLISVVFLLRRPAQLTENVVRAAAERAWGRAFRPDSNEYVSLQSTDTRGPVGFVSFEGLMFQILCGRRPYCDVEAAALDLLDMRDQEAMRSHHAFMFVDFFRPQNPSELEKNVFYQRACSLLAQLLDPGCLAVYLPETGDFRVHDGALREALASNDPLHQIKHADSRHSPLL